MDKDTARYIILHFPNLLTATEGLAQRHARSVDKLGDDGENSSRAESFRRRGLLTHDPAALSLLTAGYDAFELHICERIMAECPERVFLNKCPRCHRLARTPYARQCRHCGHDWHHINTAKFKLETSYRIMRGFYLLGEITAGEVTAGNFVDLTMLGLAQQPEIKAIEYAIRSAVYPVIHLIAFRIDELREEDIDYLLAKGSFGTPLDVLNER